MANTTDLLIDEYGPVLENSKEISAYENRGLGKTRAKQNGSLKSRPW
jgi:hypothetical protein